MEAAWANVLPVLVAEWGGTAHVVHLSEVEWSAVGREVYAGCDLDGVGRVLRHVGDLNRARHGGFHRVAL